MIITFAQYCILTATYNGATASEVQCKTTLNPLMINFYLNELLKSGFVMIVEQKNTEPLRYEVSELGLIYIEDYERANPELVIRRATYEAGKQ
ncbi:hypothetical protein [Spirosoma linguale]|uniref:ArnR1-like winged helix-turn-helix domain-containing protein n=1 Tax=Spirosoma linguale (strain ATCC 33905 / DSM 74 / LMG 10896 / Claus 1) TaxID=504472 RepID=D2QSR3_SPILD|nr:hypothetical protein Slin_5881 [Spirosoma linguale DSM 74]